MVPRRSMFKGHLKNAGLNADQIQLFERTRELRHRLARMKPMPSKRPLVITPTR